LRVFSFLGNHVLVCEEHTPPALELQGEHTADLMELSRRFVQEVISLGQLDLTADKETPDKVSPKEDETS
jgi:hypothetical protein